MQLSNTGAYLQLVYMYKYVWLTCSMVTRTDATMIMIELKIEVFAQDIGGNTAIKQPREQRLSHSHGTDFQLAQLH